MPIHKVVGLIWLQRENLSPKAGLISGGSLLVDYMLTVAVSVSVWSRCDYVSNSCIASIYNLYISIVLVLALMLMNLRGIGGICSSL